MLLCATVFTVTGTENNDANEINVALQSSIRGACDQPGTILIDFDAQTAHGETGSLGCEWDGTYLWSTWRGLTTPPHKIGKWDTSGNLLNTYNQPAQTSSWGMRDIGFDGTYLYAGSEDGFWKIDPADGTTTLMFSAIAPMTCVRAVAWVPSEGMFYSGNFGNSFYKFTPDGTTITAVTNPGLTAVYGMAYDDMNDSIWIFDQTGTPQTTIHEYDYHTQTLTGEQWVVPLLTGATAQLAGGLGYATDIVTGKATLCGMTQGTPVDRIFVMELGDSNAPPNTPAAPGGPSSGITGVSYTFTGSTTDPDGDPIDGYWFEFGDGNNSGWVLPGSASHAYAAPGTYDVTVKAKDDKGAESAFSPAHQITILAGPILNIKTVKGGIGKIKVTIENIGGENATGVNWNISLAGGAFIGKESSGGPINIPKGQSVEVSSKFIIGLGKTTITVTASCPESTDTATRSGTILFFFIYVRPGGS
jgi:hypothetical protein